MATDAAAGTPIPDEIVDEVYGGPVESFVARRDAVAKRLRAAGDKARAAEVKKLRKPSAPVAAINELARSRPQDVAELVDAGARLRQAQEAALSAPSGAGRALRDATQRLRASVQRLADAADVDTDAMRTRVAATLQAAATDPARAAELRGGRLREEIESTGFEGLAGMLTGGPTPELVANQATPSPDLQQEREEEGEERRAAELERARAAMLHARKKAKEAADAAERLERRARDAVDDVADARRRLERAKEAAESARADAEEARRVADDADAAVEEAEARYADLEDEAGA